MFGEKKHPEQKPGEVFFANMYLEDFKKLPYKTKRTGDTAYNIFTWELENPENGNKAYPVFVKKWEFVEKIYLKKFASFFSQLISPQK